MTDALELIKSRRSTRRFRLDPLPDELLRQVIEAGRYAPSGGNNQTTHFLVIRNRDVLETLADLVEREFAVMEITPGMYRSMANSITAAKKGNYVFHYRPAALIVTANRAGYGNNIADCACALENMMVAANALDLGSCYINQLRWLNEDEALVDYLRSLGMKENERVYGAVVIGYPAGGLPNRSLMAQKGNEVTWIDG